jgi:catechol 2,3-dioxygenase
MKTSESTELRYGIAPPAFRLPDATRLGRVRLQVADLGRSVAYYETVIGLGVIHRDATVATLGPRGGGDPIVELHAHPGARRVTRRGQIGLYHFAILLPTRAALGRFVRHLGAIGEYAGMSDHFVSEAVYLQDPDGLGIEVYADRPRSEWRAENNQLAMTTIPLDVNSLVAEGGDEPWTGAPQGTSLGHVHLYVRDLDQAAAFYHEGLGFDKVVWSYPGALFMSAGGYHHHLGTNTWAAGAPLPADDEARLIEWEVIVPDAPSARDAANSLESRGFSVTRDGDEVVARDHWGTQVRVRPRAA